MHAAHPSSLSPHPPTGVRRAAAWAVSMLLPLLGAGCAQQPLPTSEQETLQRWGAPTSRYTLADGSSRWEYATGPQGRTTWMMDISSQGQVRGARQVLTESELRAVQAAMPMPAQQLLQWIGRPGERRHGGRAGGEVWAWRYPTFDCLWYLVSVNAAGQALSAAFMTDPQCDDLHDGQQ